ncbi:MlaD family protein [Amycolatopsis anabasis]|uniref:MlaD family protein n=1 Tax=Amycolatopsis anabasis TaxID=1840409 RepID=UPI00131DE2F1|nr:MCE family protein [Amycolatopsis anabasis]
MLTRKIKLQVAIFVLVALAGVSYVGASYAGLDQLVGGGGLVVRADLAESGGLFTGAEVTYRGVQVGRVGPLRLTEDGISAELRLDRSAPEIPRELDAVVANRSAVGEQYLDLRPRRDDGPPLTEGAVIPRTAISLPMPVENVLSNLNGLVASVPIESLRTVVNELDEAFRGRGGDLQVLLDSSHGFVRTAMTYLPQTKRLISDADTVLRTQSEQSPAIRSFSHDVRLLAEQLRNSDIDLRRLISATPPVAGEISALLRESGPGFGLLFANLLTPARVFATRGDALEHLLSTYPSAIGAGYQVIGPDGTANLALVLNFNNPPPCRAGYEGTVYRPGRDTSPGVFNTTARCALPYGNPSSVRGSQNAPRGGPVPDPVSPLVLNLTNSASGPATLGQLLGLN